MREIVLDTETTGLNPLTGDRVVEIGCVELFNHIATDKHYHVYLNPERDVPAEVVRVHGLTNEFLADKPVFAEVVDQFREFIGDDMLVIHNASFDMGFINAELTRTGFPTLPMSRALDTVMMARKMFPGAPASLDALCKRFGIDLSGRSLHGALLDSQLLAEVYLELRGGRQPDLAIARVVQTAAESEADTTRVRSFRTPRVQKVNEAELLAHQEFVGGIKGALWRNG